MRIPRRAFECQECSAFMAEECIRMQTFETRSAFEVPISETQEWHSNIRMQDGGTFECIRMHIPSTCGGLYPGTVEGPRQKSLYVKSRFFVAPS